MGRGGAAGGFSRGQVIGAPRQEPTTLVGLANPRPVGRGRRVGAGGCARSRSGAAQASGATVLLPAPGLLPRVVPPGGRAAQGGGNGPEWAGRGARPRGRGGGRRAGTGAGASD